ncbi:glycosyltransferase [Pseudoalteromonas lipolytica]|jgi:N-acetylgalactosamine-N,N'-diacetylbacillosaminyl-diphospho-undecaprenol 4-alpha-N-acetylgalactosaminyltransferase
MKVLVVTNSKFGGGAEVIVNTLSSELAKVQDVNVFSVYLKNNNSNFWRISAFFKLLLAIIKFKPQIVQSHLFFPSLISILLSKVLFFKTQVVIHSISEIDGTNRASKIARIFYKYSGMVVCISSKMFELASMLFHNTGVQLIHNPHDFESYSNLSSEDVDIPIQNYFIYVGRLTASKRVNDLITAVANASYKHNLLIVGDGEERDSLKNLASKLGISDRVYFLGRKSNPYPYIKNAKALLLASEFEGYPNCLVEALSLGVPVITSNCKTGPAEILGVSYEEDRLRTVNISCSIYPVGNIESLVKAFNSENYLLKKPDELKKIVSHLSLNTVLDIYKKSLILLMNKMP